jgi:hypothetical protein
MDELMTVYEAHCPSCGETHSVPVKISELYAYEVLGELAQVAFKSLDSYQREAIITGLCPTCIKKIFG